MNSGDVDVIRDDDRYYHCSFHPEDAYRHLGNQRVETIIGEAIIVIEDARETIDDEHNRVLLVMGPGGLRTMVRYRRSK